MKRFLLSLPALLALAAFGLAQQPGPPPPDGPDAPPDAPDGQYEPGRAVARISVINGDVSMRRGDSQDVIAAALNAPIMAGDALLTGSAGRGEVELDGANMLRFATNSEVRFAAMDVRGFQIQVAAGTVLLRVLRPSQVQVELDTPSVAVRALREGVYRIMVREDGTSEITVRSGEAEIGSPRGTERLGPGRTMNARGPATDPEFQVTGAIPYDTWDRWNEDRDRYLTSSRSYEHVGPDVAGVEDLDQNGRWVNDPSYGQVWAPTVPPGWAPYHYGRWFYGPVGWAWYPGPIYGRHYWAPAYVGFFGFGGVGVGVGFGFGNVGWVALAPFEVFHPWWGRGFYAGYRSGVFGSHTAIVNNVNVMNTYRNARFAGGVTGVNAAQFGRGGRFTAMSGSQIQGAGMVRGVLPISPDRSSLRVSDRAAAGNFRQSNIQSFAGRSQVPSASRVPFEQQQRGMQQMSRSNFSVPSRSGAAPTGNAGGSGAGEAHGWGRFGEPIHGSSSNGPAAQGGTSNGLGRFDNSRAGAPAPNNFAPGARSLNGSGQAVRISPPMVQQRAPGGAAPSYQAPRSAPNSQPARSAPSGGSGSRSAPASRSGSSGSSRGNSNHR